MIKETALKTIGKIILFLLAFIIGISISQIVVRWTFPQGNITMMTIISIILSLVITLIVTYLFRVFVDKKSFQSLGFERAGFTQEFIVGSIFAVCMLAVGFSLMILSRVIYIENIHFKLEYFILYVFIFIATALIEEISLRGYVLNNLMDRFNKYLALIISACIFSMLHLFNADITILSTMNVFLAGIFIGASFIYTRKLWFPIGFHLFWNLIQGLLGFSVSGEEVPSILILGYPMKNILNGGDFGFEGSILCTILLIIGTIILFGYFERGKFLEMAKKT